MEPLLTQYGAYALFCSYGMQLTEHAHARFANFVTQETDFLYADARVSDAVGLERVLHKPAWSPETLLSTPYIGSPIAVRQTLLDEVGAPCSQSADELYAFTLRATERAMRIQHIPEVLACGEEQKPKYQMQIVTQALKRRNIDATVSFGLTEDSVAVRCRLPMRYRISVIVFTYGQVNAVRETLESFACQSTYPHAEYIVCDGGAPTEAGERYYAALLRSKTIRLVRRFEEHNIASMINEAARDAGGEALLILPAGVTVKQFDALERMAECAMLPDVGAVGACIGKQDKSATAYIRNVEAVDEVMLLLRDVFLEAGGFDETFPQAGFFMALCRALSWKRRRHVYTPFARFGHRTDLLLPQATTKNKLRINDMRSLRFN